MAEQEDLQATPPVRSELRIRRRPTHGVLERPDLPTIVYLTACTKNRLPWLTDPGIHDLIRKCWFEADAWQVGRYVMMPDHVHLFASPGHGEVPFDNWVRYWKSRVSRELGNPDYRWQTDHWDTRIRSAGGYSEKWEYVRLNPVRRGLVNHPAQWSLQGELHRLRWDPEE